MIDERPALPSGSSRRDFLKHGAAFGAAAFLADLALPGPAEPCDVPITGAGWPSVNGWEHRTMMHFLNAVMPGNDGQALFSGDGYPLKSGGDRTAGAWSACALDVFYDPYYGIAGVNSNLLAATLDWAVRLKLYATYFYKATQSEQLRTIDYVCGLSGVGEGFRDAASLVLAATLGAAENRTVTSLIGWPGPNGGYYGAARHPLERWRQPNRLTLEGNLP